MSTASLTVMKHNPNTSTVQTVNDTHAEIWRLKRLILNIKGTEGEPLTAELVHQEVTTT